MKEREKKIACNIKSNPKQFWKYVNSKVKSRGVVPDLTINKGESKTVITEDKEKAETLAKYFSSVFVKEPEWSWLLGEANPKNSLTIEISQDDVKTKLESLDANKSPGLDQIHSKVLKEISEVVAQPLFIIYRKSLELGKVPSLWKRSLVTPIFKNKGNRSSPSSYRPISLTSIASRIMESIIRDHLFKYLKEIKYIE